MSVVYNRVMVTNILNQSFSDFAQKAKTIEKNPQRTRLDTLASYYTNRVSNNETQLITKYADALVSGGQPHTPDPRLYMRRDLLGLVQDSYALGIADALQDLEDVQFFALQTSADFALSPDDKLQRDIAKLQRDIAQSQQIVRQTKTLNQYTNTLQTLQNQAQALNNTQATQTLTGLSEDLQRLKTGNTVKAATRVINQQLEKGNKQRQSIISDINQKQREAAEDAKNEEYIYSGEKEYYDRTPDTQDYLVKRAIEEKLRYLQNRKDALTDTPPVVLDEDTDFFRWYADKRLVPIANRYQQGIVDKNNEAKDIATKYTEEINKRTTTQTARGIATDKIVRKLLSIEDSSTPSPKDKKRPIKRVQRVVATELAIAYNVGRLKAYMKAGIQYVTISTSMYSTNKCDYCLDTEAKSIDNPISIASLLKRAYRNEGFDKSLNRPIEQRYLIHHPFCYCFYKPHPKQDPKEDGDSTGIYADPNAWKFILGAGLGVSLVFLAFALTTGRKIVPPSVVPSALPIRATQAIPEIVTDNIPTTIPVRAVAPTELIPLPLLQRSIQNLTKEQQSVYADIISDTTIPIDIRLAQVYAQAADDLITVNTKDFLTLETQVTQVTQVTATKGVVRAFINKQVDKIQQTYDRNTQALATRIAQEQAKAQAIDPQNPTKSVIAGVSNSVKNINKTYVQSQLKSIQTTKQIALESYNKVTDKIKPSDLKYKAELQQRLDTLSSMEQSLLEQKQVLGDIQEYLNDLVVPTKAVVRKTTKAVIQQQLSNTTAAVDRLIDGSRLTTIVDKTMQTTRLQQAQEEYEKLLELLVDLSPTESSKYTKRVQDLNRRIKSAQGINLKRFMGGMVGFSKYGV